MQFSLTVILSFLFLCSCNFSKPVAGFEDQVWKNDVKGCLGKRRTLAQEIVKNKKAWNGLDDDVLLEMLGKPDKSFYYERNAKAFTYFIEPGNQCKDNGHRSEGRKLTAEINATGFVNMVRIEN